mgnify:CR=1 FL=1
MNIRERNHGDDLALVDIWLRSVRATHTFLTEKEIQAMYPKVLNTYLPSVRVWVCEDDAGEVAAGCVDDKSRIPMAVHAARVAAVEAEPGVS